MLRKCSRKSGDGKSTRFDKPLEEFFSICNQIELHLKTIYESVIQQRDGQKYVPFSVNLKNDASGVESPADNSLSYKYVSPFQTNYSHAISLSQYLNTVKSQINFCKQVQEILSEGVKKIDQQESMPQS